MKIFHDLNKKTSVFLVNSNWNNKPQTQKVIVRGKQI